MQIIIPMSGFGERFRRAGYSIPKPLIEVDGLPIIQHVIEMFPGETGFIFICNRDHLDIPEFRLAETLKEICPTGRIVSIPPHKLGPVHAVMEAGEHIDPDAPTVVNYCDFACLWDYPAFKKFVADTVCDGAVACYKGFHPHMLRNFHYAYVREVEGWISAIQEKEPYTDTPMDEFASSGTYYFKTGDLLKEYFSRTLARDDLKLNGEFYVSLAYRPMLEDGCRVAVFEQNRFAQWGTPEDLAEYRHWSKAFSRLAEGFTDQRTSHEGMILMPMAGMGERFAREGYELTKPLIPVSGIPMVVQAAGDLPETSAHVFIMRQDMAQCQDTEEVLKKRFPDCRTVLLDAPTDGQARTCMLGLDGVNEDAPLTIGACDNGLLYRGADFDELWSAGADVIVWAARGHPGAIRNPEMYGWIDTQTDGRIRRVSVKVPLTTPTHDPIVTGAFTFRRARDFKAAVEQMIERDGRIGGEFYIDECINDAVAMKLDCRVFDIDFYLCWGTPNDLRTFEYWQSYFHHWPRHGYRTETDPRCGDVTPSLDRIAWR